MIQKLCPRCKGYNLVYDGGRDLYYCTGCKLLWGLKDLNWDVERAGI